MRKLFLITILFLMPSCKLKGPQGERGETGAMGDPGPGAIRIYSGPVTSDDFTVTIPERPATIAQITIYVSDGSTFAELPYFLPAQGVNAFAIYRPGTISGTIQFVNLVRANTVQWQAVVILK